MTPTESGWARFTQPGFDVTFEYPEVTPDGHDVVRTEERVEDHPLAGSFERVHLSSPGGEVYLEVARFPGRTPEDEYRSHLPHLVHRFGEGAVTGLAETTAGDLTAWKYGFRWDEGERSVLLFQVAQDTYRVIHDPRSELNARIVGTFRVLA